MASIYRWQLRGIQRVQSSDRLDTEIIPMLLRVLASLRDSSLLCA